MNNFVRTIILIIYDIILNISGIISLIINVILVNTKNITFKKMLYR